MQNPGTVAPARGPSPPVDAAKAVSLHSYRCESCGGHATWQPAKREVACRSCGTVVALAAAETTPAASFPLVQYLRDSPENRRRFTPERVERPCPTCSHIVVFESAVEGTICAACLTPLLRSPHGSDMPIRPTGVVPFAIDEADARERLRTWWRDWRGSDPRTRRLEPGPLVARYVPCWQFSVRVSCPWRHVVTREDGSEDTYQGEIRGDYGEREPASHGVPTDLLRAVPFPFERAIAYDRRYLAGAIVEHYDADMFDAWMAARARLNDLVNRLVNKDAGVIGGPEERWPDFSDEKGWLILAPLYTTTIEIAGKSHHIVIDGDGGRVASTVPPALPLGALLVLAGLAAGMIALVWWVVSMWLT